MKKSKTMIEKRRYKRVLKKWTLLAISLTDDAAVKLLEQDAFRTTQINTMAKMQRVKNVLESMTEDISGSGFSLVRYRALRVLQYLMVELVTDAGAVRQLRLLARVVRMIDEYGTGKAHVFRYGLQIVAIHKMDLQILKELIYKNSSAKNTGKRSARVCDIKVREVDFPFFLAYYLVVI